MGAELIEIINNLLISSRYSVDGNSMSPALKHGDQVLAARVKRQYRRGDVVVFQRQVRSRGVDIKRIIGLPEEEIFLGDDGVLINGTVLLEQYLPGGSNLIHADREYHPPRETDRVWITELGEYFVMGDRRENSQDSRSFGPVTENSMLGRVWLRYWPLRAWNTISTSGQTSDNNHPYTR